MKKRIALLAAVPALLLPSAGLSASLTEGPQDTPVAVVMKVDGDVNLVRRSGPVPATVGAALAVGDRVEPAEGARAVVVHRTGQKQEITETTTVEAPRTAARGDAFDRTVRVLAQAANSNARTSPNRQGMIRPLPGQVVKVRPRLGIAVASQRPTFVWRSFEGTEGYTIQIRQPGERPVRFQTRDTVFTLPPDTNPLEPGATYHWTVAPASTNRPAEEDSFRVMSAETETRLEEGIEAIEALGFDTDDDGRVMAAAVLADLGLYYAAAEALATIEEAGPPGPDLLMLKGEVLDELGRVEEAQESFDRADRAIRR